jgi:hypothetical protein
VTNSWSAEVGGAVCPQCADDSLRLMSLSLNALKVLRLLQKGSYAECARVRLSHELASEVEACLGDQIRYVLEREVRSSRFLESLESLPAARAPVVVTAVAAEAEDAGAEPQPESGNEASAQGFANS